MLIGIDASRANRDHKTGTEWYSYYLIRWLAKLDKKNKYILYTDKPLKNGLADLTTEDLITNHRNIEENQIDKNGYQLIKSPYGNFKAKILNWPFSFFWTLGRLSWEMLIRKPEILFIPAHTLPLISPQKTIATIHDIAFVRDQELYRRDKIGPEDNLYRKYFNFLIKIFTFWKYGADSTDYLNWSTRFTLRHAKKIITVSYFTRKELTEFFKYPPEKVKVIYNGYNNLLYQRIEKEEESRPILERHDIAVPYILYVGRLEKKKNISALIEAYALARENYNIKEKLVLVGDAGFGYDEVKYVIGQYNLDDEVILTGWVKEKDMPYIYSDATAFIFPSKHEGFGIPLLQAMGCQVPVATSDIQVLREIAGQAALFFNPNDTGEISQAIAKIITDKELRKKLIASGNEKIKFFSWKKCAEETLKTINDM